MGGIRHTTGPADGPSTRTGISLGDSLAGLFVVIGVLAALAERSQSGRDRRSTWRCTRPWPRSWS